MTYKLYWERDGVTKWHVGDLSSEDLLNSTLEIQRSPIFDSMRWIISDMRDCIKVSVAPNTLEQVVAAYLGAVMSNPRLKIAVVSDSPEVIQLAERYKAAVRDEFPVEIFPNISAAREWIESMDGHFSLPKTFSASKYW